MGFQDRDYYQQRDDKADSLSPIRDWVADFTVIHYLIALNAVIWLVCIFTPVTYREEVFSDGTKRMIKAEAADSRLPAARHTLDDALALRTNFVREAPWNFWQLLTYGFVHSPMPLHLVFNMLGLWIFGREVEGRLGNREFLAVYLVSIVMAGLAAVAYHTLGAGFLPKARPETIVVGASGAISAIVVCFGCLLGNRKVRLAFPPIGEIPAWSLAAGFVAIDILGQFLARDNVAYEAHLGGAAFGFAYCMLKWNLTRWLPEKWFGGGEWFATQPDLRVYDPETESERESEFEASLGDAEGYAAYRDEDEEFDQVADRLLEKVHREGAGSLTAEERQILEEYSRRIRNKRGR